jgi:hypothetical protein
VAQQLAHSHHVCLELAYTLVHDAHSEWKVTDGWAGPPAAVDTGWHDSVQLGHGPDTYVQDCHGTPKDLEEKEMGRYVLG